MTAGADKSFATLRAKFALRGHELHRTHMPDGRTSYWTARWGLTKPLADLEDVRDFLRKIGGAHDGHSGH